MDITITERMAEELRVWVDDERDRWPRGTAYQNDLDALARQLDACIAAAAIRRREALSALIAEDADYI